MARPHGSKNCIHSKTKKTETLPPITNLSQERLHLLLDPAIERARKNGKSEDEINAALHNAWAEMEQPCGPSSEAAARKGRKAAQNLATALGLGPIKLLPGEKP